MSPVQPVSPSHPLPALTTFELARARRDLEYALLALPGDAPARGPLQQQLAAIQAEQQSRSQIAARPRS